LSIASRIGIRPSTPPGHGEIGAMASRRGCRRNWVTAFATRVSSTRSIRSSGRSNISPNTPNRSPCTQASARLTAPRRRRQPRSNVIVRLCSIECNFREPLDQQSNAAFADDLRGWSKLCQRLYVWDYTTDFAHYVQPHPNWFTLGPNLRFFQQHHVRGVFEQGAYQSHGSEMAELRAWLLAQLLWNPHQDDRALIDEFLDGYYGPAAAPHLRRYLDLMHDASRGYNLTCYSPNAAPHLRFHPLA